jgi:putative nucleotidyltransferase with HDIG domain
VSLDRLARPLAAAAAFAILPPGLLHLVGRDQTALSGTVHFAAVGGTALAATAAGIALSVVGARRRDPRSVLAGTAFAAMAALLAVHGAATPGILVGYNGVVAFSGAATLPVGGAVLALAALPGVRGPLGIRLLLALQVVLVAGIVALGAIGLAAPSLIPDVPEPSSPPAYALLVLGLAFFGLLAFRATRTFLLGRRRSDLLVAVGTVWLGAALVGALVLDYTQLGWWLGHLFEIVGIALIGIPVTLDLRRQAQSRPLLGDLSGVDLVVAEEAYLGSDVHALLEQLADKDAYTEGHTRRVALLAVQLGEALGLPAIKLRDLATGGLLHDVGKLSIPQEILAKPGPLDDVEFQEIRRHPERGERLLGELGFPTRVRRLVLDHHERLNGSGYPRGLGRTMPFEARILAVCDVYDALISPRVYRPAWDDAQALAYLKNEAGTLFDRRCVAALERVLGREPQAVAV